MVLSVPSKFLPIVLACEKNFQKVCKFLKGKFCMYFAPLNHFLLILTAVIVKL